MRTMAYLLILLGIAASDPVQLFAKIGLEFGLAIPAHPLIQAVHLFGVAVQTLVGG